MFLPLSTILFASRYRRNRTGRGAGIGQGSAKRTARPATRNSRTAPDARLCLSKYLALFVRKYRPRCRLLCTEVCLQLRRSLYSRLCRGLPERLCASLYHGSYATLLLTLYRSSFEALLASFLRQRYRWSCSSACRALCRRRLSGRRPGGRPPHGRIVVPAMPTTICRWWRRSLSAELRGKSPGGLRPERCRRLPALSYGQ